MKGLTNATSCDVAWCPKHQTAKWCCWFDGHCLKEKGNIVSFFKRTHVSSPFPLETFGSSFKFNSFLFIYLFFFKFNFLFIYSFPTQCSRWPAMRSYLICAEEKIKVLLSIDMMINMTKLMNLQYSLDPIQNKNNSKMTHHLILVHAYLRVTWIQDWKKNFLITVCFGNRFHYYILWNTLLFFFSFTYIYAVIWCHIKLCGYKGLGRKKCINFLEMVFFFTSNYT